MLMKPHVTRSAVKALRGYMHMFSAGDIEIVGGVDSPHILRRQEFPGIDVSALHADKLRGSIMSCESGHTHSSSCSDSATQSITSNFSGGSRGRPKKRVWRRLFGWTNETH